MHGGVPDSRYARGPPTPHTRGAAPTPHTHRGPPDSLYTGGPNSPHARGAPRVPICTGPSNSPHTRGAPTPHTRGWGPPTPLHVFPPQASSSFSHRFPARNLVPTLQHWAPASLNLLVQVSPKSVTVFNYVTKRNG